MPIYDGVCHTCNKVKKNIHVNSVMEEGDLFSKDFCDCGGVLVKKFSADGQSGKAGDTPIHYGTGAGK